MVKAPPVMPPIFAPLTKRGWRWVRPGFRPRSNQPGSADHPSLIPSRTGLPIPLPLRRGTRLAFPPPIRDQSCSPIPAWQDTARFLVAWPTTCPPASKMFPGKSSNLARSIAIAIPIGLRQAFPAEALALLCSTAACEWSVPASVLPPGRQPASPTTASPSGPIGKCHW